MKLNIKLSNHKTYAEVPQVNKLRWKTLFREEGNTFIDQSGWIKCKDFFNDTVAFFKEGSVFSIYGYQNNIKKNDEGVYFLLKYVEDKPSFFKNLEAVNERLEQDLQCRVDYLDADEWDEVVVLIPNELWESTYRISLITMLIRLCNYNVLYEDWEAIWDKKSPVNTVEHAFTEDAKAMARERGFLVPEKFKDMWYFAGKAYNSIKNPKVTGPIIHNNGCSNWNIFMKIGEV